MSCQRRRLHLSLKTGANGVSIRLQEAYNFYIESLTLIIRKLFRATLNDKILCISDIYNFVWISFNWSAGSMCLHIRDTSIRFLNRRFTFSLFHTWKIAYECNSHHSKMMGGSTREGTAPRILQLRCLAHRVPTSSTDQTGLNRPPTWTFYWNL